MEYFNLFCIFILFVQGAIYFKSLDDLKKDIKLVAKNPNLARKIFNQRNDNL